MPFILSILLFCSLVQADGFGLQTIEDQLKEAEGVIQGQFLEKSMVRLENNEVSTKMIFKIRKEYGLQSELYGMDEVIVHYPGEEEKGVLVPSAGVPEFVTGESVVLFIKTIDNRYWGQNSGFGSFKLINYGQKSMLINSLYPKNVKVSQMDLNDFEERVREIKGASLKVVQADQSLNSDETDVPVDSEVTAKVQGPYRSIASESKDEDTQQEQRPYSNSYSLVTFLALTGGLFRLMRQKRIY